MNKELVAYTQDRAMRLSGLSRRQVNYWSDTDLLKPSVEERLTPHRPIRLYSYRDMLSLLVIARLRTMVSLQAVRTVVGHVRARDFEPNEVVFSVDGTRVYFQLPDGSWESGFEPGQGVLHTLELEPIRVLAMQAGRRDPGSVGKVERRRGALGSKPLVAGTRVPVAAVRRYLERGATTAEILEAYPSLEPDDVETARTHLA